jgi:hypothetical protein
VEPLGDLSTRDRCDPNLWLHSERYGWVHIAAADRTRSKVDKTFGYVRDDDGNLRIVVYHSLSLFSGY